MIYQENIYIYLNIAMILIYKRNINALKMKREREGKGKWKEVKGSFCFWHQTKRNSQHDREKNSWSKLQIQQEIDNILLLMFKKKEANKSQWQPIFGIFLQFPVHFSIFFFFFTLFSLLIKEIDVSIKYSDKHVFLGVFFLLLHHK